MEKKRRRKKIERKEVPEIFEIEKDGKEKIIKTHGEVEEEKAPSEEQIKKENKIFKNIIIVMVGFALMFFVVYLIVNSMKYFEVGGVKFEIVKEGALTLYKTSLPVTYNESLATYNFYLRNDPRVLKEKVLIIGNISFRKNMVFDVTTEDLFCDGDWTIGLVNVQHLYEILDINLLVKNDSIKYQPAWDYMFITINKGNQTEIKKVDVNSYEININDCEVLLAFEKLMLETFIRDKELNK